MWPACPQPWERAELLRASLPMPLPVLGCHQCDTWAGWEQGALLVPTAVVFTPGPPLLPLGTARVSAARGSCRAARGREEPASCIPHPAPRGAAVSLAVLHSPTSPSPQRDFGTHVHFGKRFGVWRKLAKALRKWAQPAPCAQSPRRAPQSLLLPGPSEAPRPSRAGLCRPGGWDTAAGTAAWIWQQLCFGRNYKETLCPAAKKPDKNLWACEWWGEKRVSSVLSLRYCLPVGFLGPPCCLWRLRGAAGCSLLSPCPGSWEQPACCARGAPRQQHAAPCTARVPPQRPERRLPGTGWDGAGAVWGWRCRGRVGLRVPARAAPAGAPHEPHPAGARRGNPAPRGRDLGAAGSGAQPCWLQAWIIGL